MLFTVFFFVSCSSSKKDDPLIQNSMCLNSVSLLLEANTDYTIDPFVVVVVSSGLYSNTCSRSDTLICNVDTYIHKV